MWTTIWSAISALATVATFAVAVWAMFRWNKQEQLKAKQEFRKAISLYSDFLSQMPNSVEDENVMRQNAKKLDDLTTCYITCAHAWLGTEGMLEDNKLIKTSWVNISEGQKNYIDGRATAMEINAFCRDIMAAKFVFK